MWSYLKDTASKGQGLNGAHMVTVRNVNDADPTKPEFVEVSEIRLLNFPFQFVSLVY